MEAKAKADSHGIPMPQGASLGFRGRRARPTSAKALKHRRVVDDSVDSIIYEDDEEEQEEMKWPSYAGGCETQPSGETSAQDDEPHGVLHGIEARNEESPGVRQTPSVAPCLAPCLSPPLTGLTGKLPAREPDQLVEPSMGDFGAKQSEPDLNPTEMAPSLCDSEASDLPENQAEDGPVHMFVPNLHIEDFTAISASTLDHRNWWHRLSLLGPNCTETQIAKVGFIPDRFAQHGGSPVDPSLPDPSEIVTAVDKMGQAVPGLYGCKKTTLLEFEGGTIFEAEGDLLKLKGGALAVAAAAAAAGRVTRKVGRRKSPQHLLTKAGFATKEDTARYLQRRIEGLLMTAGDGVLQFKAVLRALALQPSHALKRWLPKVGLRSSANGDLWVDPYRLFSFRMYRILEAASFVSEQNGEVSLQDLMEHLYRPPELLKDEEHELTAEARAVAFDMGLAPSPSVEEWRLEARDRYWRKGEASLPALPPPRETVEFREGTLALESEMDRAELSTEAVKFEIVLAEKQVEPPLWLEAWIREYFVVEEDKVFLPFLEPWRKPVPRDPDLEPVEVSHVQQEALPGAQVVNFGGARMKILRSGSSTQDIGSKSAMASLI
eukprot:g5318.t1